METEQKEKKEEAVQEGHHKPEHHKEGKLGSHSTKKISIKGAITGLLVLLGIILVVNLLLAFNINKTLKNNMDMEKEKAKPAKIELALLKDSKCRDCSGILSVVSLIKQLNVNITKERSLEFDSKEGKEIISRYKIKKVPNVIVTGETDKFGLQGFEKKGDALVLSEISPPYADAATGKVSGRVTLYSLKPEECEKCNDLSTILGQIKGAGVKIYEEKIVSPKSDEGKKLIQKYNIGFIPTLILSKDAGEYPIIKEAWAQVGSKEADAYVLRLVNPPFINLTTGKLEGIVDITYLSDKSCAECYNVSLHKSILTSPQSFAMALGKEESYDINNQKGKELVAKYNITKVPTIILSGDVAVYPSIRIIRQFFLVQKDGSYVFTSVSGVGAYKDLSTGKVVAPQPQQQNE